MFKCLPFFKCTVYTSPLRVGAESFIVVQDAVPERHDVIISRKKNQDST